MAPEVVIDAFFINKRFVSALFHNFALLEDDYPIHFLYSRKSVRYHDSSPAFH